jgi:hypothetical protein
VDTSHQLSAREVLLEEGGANARLAAVVAHLLPVLSVPNAPNLLLPAVASRLLAEETDGVQTGSLLRPPTPVAMFPPVPAAAHPLVRVVKASKSPALLRQHQQVESGYLVI